MQFIHFFVCHNHRAVVGPAVVSMAHFCDRHDTFPTHQGTKVGNMDNDEIVASFASLNISKTHATVGLSNLLACNRQYRSLFINRRLPEVGWSDVQIQHLLFTLSTLDTNNKAVVGSNIESRWCGVGEREGRVYSSLVSNRHFGLSHGMGRSGDIIEPQPKAVGSTVLVKLTLLLALDAIRRGSGLNPKDSAAHGILLPLCTGMSISLVLSSLREIYPKKGIVLWSRIDQKSCFKAIQSAGLHCIVVPTKQDGDEVVTDLAALAAALDEHGGMVLAVITTTSCFAPRVPDKVDEVAKLCQIKKVHHIVNNAYGLQSVGTSKSINRACVVGRVDAIVCSTDKNFLVPVGMSDMQCRNYINEMQRRFS
jgi:O-phospho-L-seryl-tRNASec:L-selenocysteinyl-tRNA synthase